MLQASKEQVPVAVSMWCDFRLKLSPGSMQQGKFGSSQMPLILIHLGRPGGQEGILPWNHNSQHILTIKLQECKKLLLYLLD